LLTDIGSSTFFQYYAQLLKDGPYPEPFFEQTAAVFDNLAEADLSPEEREWLIYLGGELFTDPDSVYAHVIQRPYGFAGDFETIERIYLPMEHPDLLIRRWNQYARDCEAGQAVRNRKQITKQLMHSALRRTPAPRILSVACGGARDVFDLLVDHPDFTGTIVLLDIEPAAVGFARTLLGELDHDATIHYVVGNALTDLNSARALVPGGEFDLAYSAGLADYLTDTTLRGLLRRMKKLLSDRGELMIGNFGDTNPQRAMMDFFDWELIYRSATDMSKLIPGVGSGMVYAEPAGVNLFFHHDAAETYDNGASYRC
jgi:SAM-dependent methyltransferase